MTPSILTKLGVSSPPPPTPQPDLFAPRIESRLKTAREKIRSAFLGVARSWEALPAGPGRRVTFARLHRDLTLNKVELAITRQSRILETAKTEQVADQCVKNIDEGCDFYSLRAQQILAAWRP